MATKNKPIAQYRNGNLKSSIWQDKPAQDGHAATRHAILIQKSYKDAESGQWVNCQLRLFPAEAARLVSVLQAAYDACVLKRID